MATEWWSYRLSDFLLFAPRTYWRLFELHNTAFWPLHVLAVAAGLLALALILRRPDRVRPVAVLLALAWIVVGWSFLWQRYASINWSMVYVAPLFLLQAVALVIAGALNALPAAPGAARRATGTPLAVAAIVAYPLLSPLSGRSWVSAEVFGIAPDPTAIATLGFLLLVRGRPAALLYPIPLAWCLLSGATLLAMGESQGWVPLAAALLAVVTAIWPFYSRFDRQSSG